MSEILKMAIGSFELREQRTPTEEEIKVLENSLENAYEENIFTGCSINYS